MSAATPSATVRPGSDPRHLHTPAGMRRMLEDAGFDVSDQRRLRLIGPGVATLAVKPAR